MDLPQEILSQRKAESLKSLLEIKDRAAQHNRLALSLLRATYKRIASLLTADITADISPLLEEFRQRILALIGEDIQYGIDIATNQTDNAIVPPIPTIGDYEPIINRYTDVLKEEVEWFRDSGFSAKELPLFLANPLAFSAHNDMVGDFKDAVLSVDKGVAYDTKKNLFKAGIATLMLSYTESLIYKWRGNTDIIGYVGFRQSDYPCDLCESNAGVFHPIGEMIYPLHIHCVCGVYYIKSGEV